jgi:hypothetical protein
MPPHANDTSRYSSDHVVVVVVVVVVVEGGKKERTRMCAARLGEKKRGRKAQRKADSVVRAWSVQQGTPLR